MNRHIFKALLIKIGILGLGFFSTMVITRILTIEDVGLYIFFISTTMLLCFFLDFGCNSSFFKLINSSHTNAKLDLVNKQKSELLSFKVSFVSLLLIITVPVFFIAFFINDTFSLNYYILIVISSSILTFQLSFSTLNRATGNFVLSQLNYELIPNIIRIALLSIVYFLGLKANEFYWVICVILISTSLPLLNNIYANKHLMLNIKISISCVVRIVRNNSGLAWVALVLYCHTQLDVILLQLMGSNHDVGGYGIANRISSLFALTLGVANVVVPNYVGKFITNNSHDKLSTLFGKYSLVMLLIVLAQFIILSLVGSDLMLLWGVDYLAYFDVVVMLCIGQSALMVFSLASHILFLSDKQIINTVSETTCFILNIILNILLIPKYGALGAALGTTISFTILSIIKFLAVLQYFSDMNRKIIT